MVETRTIKDKIEICFSKFELSPKMERIRKIIINSPFLGSVFVNFKISSQYYKHECCIDLQEKIFAEGSLIKDAMAVARLIISKKNFPVISWLIRYIKKRNIRFGFSVRDGSPIGLKIYLLDISNVTNSINGFIRDLGVVLKTKIPYHKDAFVGIEFKDSLKAVSVYNTINDIKKLDFKKNSSVRKKVFALHLQKKEYWLIGNKFSNTGEFICSKIYRENYDYEKGATQTVKEASIFLDDDTFGKVIKKEFGDFILKTVAIQIENGKKGVYIFK